MWSQAGHQRSLERTTGCFHPREVVVQSLIHVQLFVTPWTASRQAVLSFTISQSLLKLMSIGLSSNHLIACCLLLLLSSNRPSIKVFSNESAISLRCPKCWSFITNTSVQVFQHQSFQWIFKIDSLQDWLFWSPCCPRDISQKRYGQSHRATLNFMLWMNSDNLKVTAGRSVRMLLQKNLGKNDGHVDQSCRGVDTFWK